MYHRNHGSLSREDLSVLFQACKWPRDETAPSDRPTIRVTGTSWTSNLPQYELSHQFFGPTLNLGASHFCSFRIPRRTHPFRSLLRLARPRSVCPVLFSTYHGHKELLSTADGIPSPVKHDVQGDAVTVAAVGMGTRRGPPRRLDGSGGPYAEAQGHCWCFACGSVSGHECEVHSPFVHPWVAELICVLSRFLSMPLPWSESTIPLFVKCLESLPNLHMLEIPWADASVGSPLKKALKHIKLPQIKTLIIPPAAHSLLRHCRDIEDLACSSDASRKFPSDTILGSLASNRDSKIKRLMIPLILWANPSRK